MFGPTPTKRLRTSKQRSKIRIGARRLSLDGNFENQPAEDFFLKVESDTLLRRPPILAVLIDGFVSSLLSSRSFEKQTSRETLLLIALADDVLD